MRPFNVGQNAPVMVVYVLHAFQKKSKTGRKTPQEDVKLIAERLKRAQADFEGR